MPSSRVLSAALSLSLFGCTSGAPPRTPKTAEPAATPVAGVAPADLHAGPWIIDRYEAKHLQEDAAEIAIALTASGRFWVTDHEIWVADANERHVFARLVWDGPERAKLHRGETEGSLRRESTNALALETQTGVLALHLVPFEAAKVVKPLCLLFDRPGKPGHVTRRETCEPAERAFDSCQPASLVGAPPSDLP